MTREHPKKNRRLSTFFAAIEKLNGSLSWLVMALVIITNAITALEVFRRYVLNNPSTWALEAALVIQVFLPMLASAYVLKEGGHVSVTILIDRLSIKRRNLILGIVSIIGLAFCIILAILSWRLLLNYFLTRQVTPGGFPSWVLELSVILGFCLLALQFIVNTHKYLAQASEKVASNDR